MQLLQNTPWCFQATPAKAAVSSDDHTDDGHMISTHYGEGGRVISHLSVGLLGSTAPRALITTRAACIDDTALSTAGRGMWLSSVAMMLVLRAGPGIVRDKSVVELGAGSGLPGLYAASACGARSVLLTDRDMSALMTTTLVNKAVPGVRSARLDWTAGSTPEPALDADVVLASDCLYNPAHGKTFVETLDRVLSSRPGSTCIVVTPQRRSADEPLYALMAMFPSSHGLSRIDLEVHMHLAHEDDGAPAQSKQAAAGFTLPLWLFQGVR